VWRRWGGALDVDTTANSGSLGGNITDTGAGKLLVTGTTALNAGNQAVTLNNPLNNFGGAVSGGGRRPGRDAG